MGGISSAFSASVERESSPGSKSKGVKAVIPLNDGILFLFLLRVAKKTKNHKPIDRIKSPFLFRRSKSKKNKQMHAKKYFNWI